jgi:hypothetical protein
MANLFCTVSMQTLTSYPFSITQGTLVQFRISASNSLGFSIPSTLNLQGVMAQVKPLQPILAPIRGVGTSFD